MRWRGRQFSLLSGGINQFLVWEQGQSGVLVIEPFGMGAFSLRSAVIRLPDIPSFFLSFFFLSQVTSATALIVYMR